MQQWVVPWGPGERGTMNLGLPSALLCGKSTVDTQSLDTLGATGQHRVVRECFRLNQQQAPWSSKEQH